MRQTMRMMSAAALLIAAQCGSGAMAQGPTAAPSQRLPVPPSPPESPPPASPTPGPPTPGPLAPGPPNPGLSTATTAAACSQQDAKTKAERLLDLLRFLIVRDPNRAQVLLNEFQGAVQRFQDRSAGLAATCRSYDSLIARATE